MLYELAIAGGITYAIVKARPKRKRVIDLLVNRQSPDIQNKRIFAPPHKRINKAVQSLKERQLAPLLDKTRDQQIVSITQTELEISEIEKESHRSFIRASITLALATVNVFYPPLIWLTTPALVYTSIPFYRRAFHRVFREHKISSYALDAVLITGLLLGHFYYFAAMTMWLLSLSRMLLLQSEDQSVHSLGNLMEEMPSFVWTFVDGIEVERPFEKLQLGDIVVVSADQIIPVDGTIVDGVAVVDQDRLLGESQPLERGVGDLALALTTVLSGKIFIRTEVIGDETAAAQVSYALEQLSSFRNITQSRGEATVDKATVPTLIMSAFLLPVFGPSSALAVLMNTFGYRLRLFTPTSFFAFLKLASQKGILIKDGRSLEILGKIDTIIFDKLKVTPQAQQIISNLSERELLIYITSVYITSEEDEQPTQKIIQMIGADHYLANSSPKDKATLVEQLQQEGRIVCFVGDGIHASIALKKSNVSISLSGVTSVDADAAQVVLMNGTLEQLEPLLALSEDFETVMRNNYLLSTIPSLIILGGTLFLHWGIAIGFITTNGVLFLGLGNSVRSLFKKVEMESL